MTYTDADFLPAILANPSDDGPRLVYADWLEEQGSFEQGLRAQFIRTQIELAKLPPRPEVYTVTGGFTFWRGSGTAYVHAQGKSPPQVGDRISLTIPRKVINEMDSHQSTRLKGLKTSWLSVLVTSTDYSMIEFKVDEQSGAAWPGELLAKQEAEILNTTVSYSEHPSQLRNGKKILLPRWPVPAVEQWSSDSASIITDRVPLPHGQVGFMRGFVGHVECGPLTFERVAAHLFKVAPITSVVLAGTEPDRTIGHGWRWMNSVDMQPGQYLTNAVVFNRIHAYLHPEHRLGYTSRREALEDLSRACVEFGRERAGLPPILLPRVHNERPAFAHR